MKAPKEKRSAQLHILISEQEMDKIRERMAQTGITNTSAFIRKMAIDGYVINLDLSEVRELTRLLRICSNNLNQYARKAHETGSIYGADIADLQSRMDGLWEIGYCRSAIPHGWAVGNCKKAADRIYKHSMNIQKNGCFPVARSGRIFMKEKTCF